MAKISSADMSEGLLAPNMTNKFQKEVSEIAGEILLCSMLWGGLSVNLNI